MTNETKIRMIPIKNNALARSIESLCTIEQKEVFEKMEQKNKENVQCFLSGKVS